LFSVFEALMDWGTSLLSKVGEKVRSLEADVTKELGLRNGDGQAGDEDEWEAVGTEREAPDADGWEDDGWEDVDVTPGAMPTDDDGFEDVAQGPDASSEAVLQPAKEDLVSPSVKDEEGKGGSGEQVDQKRDALLSDLRRQQQELESRTAEARSRSEVVQRKINALQREENSLRRGRDAGNKSLEVQEKDERIAAVLAERDGLKSKIEVKEAEVEKMEKEIAELSSRRNDLFDLLQAGESKREASNARIKQLDAAEKTAKEAREAAEARLRAAGSETRTREGALVALEATRKELEKLRNSQETSLKELRESIVRETNSAKDKAQNEAEATEGLLKRELAALRAHLTQLMESTGWKEDNLRRELADLRKRSQQLELRNEELSAAVPDATRPLLRQLEQLQAESNERSSRAAVAERAQGEKLREIELQNAAAVDREKAADSRISALMTRNATLKEQLKLGREEESRIKASLEEAERSLAAAEVSYVNEMERMRHQIAKVKSDSARVEETGRQELESSEKTVRSLERGVEEAKTSLQALKDKTDSVRAQTEAASKEIATVAQSPRSDSGAPVSPYTDARRMGSLEAEGTSELRDLYATVTNLQSQLSSKEAALQALGDEVVEHTLKCEELEQDLASQPTVRMELEALTARHDALLALYGEKEERIQEYEQDIEDVKVMYKEQMTELFMELERAQSAA